MASERERYLRQQIELGGAELYRTAPSPTVVPPDSAAPEPSPELEASLVASSTDPPAPPESPATAPGSEVNAPSRRTDPLPPGASRWMKDLPPIPGAGLTVHPPEAALLGDGLGGLERLEQVAALIGGCRKCVLCEGRKHTVPGEGNPEARLMCIGEGPGATEDETGRPFVGAAGQLLDRMLAAIDCPRETVFIANIVKCRPPQNRPPLPDEAEACLPYLHRQIALVRPTVLLALGGSAASYLLGAKGTLGSMRGKIHRYAGIPLVVTYHPAALLRNPNWKKPTWDDVRIAKQLLGA